MGNKYSVDDRIWYTDRTWTTEELKAASTDTLAARERKAKYTLDFGDPELKQEFKAHCRYLGISFGSRIRELIKKDISWHRKRRIKALKDQ